MALETKEAEISDISNNIWESYINEKQPIRVLVHEKNKKPQLCLFIGTEVEESEKTNVIEKLLFGDDKTKYESIRLINCEIFNSDSINDVKKKISYFIGNEDELNVNHQHIWLNTQQPYENVIDYITELYYNLLKYSKTKQLKREHIDNTFKRMGWGSISKYPSIDYDSYSLDLLLTKEVIEVVKNLKETQSVSYWLDNKNTRHYLPANPLINSKMVDSKMYASSYNFKSSNSHTLNNYGNLLSINVVDITKCNLSKVVLKKYNPNTNKKSDSLDEYIFSNYKFMNGFYKMFKNNEFDIHDMIVLNNNMSKICFKLNIFKDNKNFTDFFRIN